MQSAAPLKEGWLVKQGHTLLSGWTRRWFSLHCRGATVPATAGSAAEEGTDARSSSSDGQQQRQELVLEYFEDEAKTAARKKGEFVLLPGSAVQRWADTDKHEHCVRLSNSSGVYIIAGRDSSEATEWVQALLEALWTHQGNALPAAARQVYVAGSMLRAWHLGDRKDFAAHAANAAALTLVQPERGKPVTYTGMGEIWAMRSLLGEGAVPQYVLDSFTFPHPGVLHCKATEPDGVAADSGPSCCFTFTFDSRGSVLRCEQEERPAGDEDAAIVRITAVAVAFLQAWVNFDRLAFLNLCAAEVTAVILPNPRNAPMLLGADEIWASRAELGEEKLPHSHTFTKFRVLSPHLLQCTAQATDGATGVDCHSAEVTFSFEPLTDKVCKFLWSERRARVLPRKALMVSTAKGLLQAWEDNDRQAYEACVCENVHAVITHRSINVTGVRSIWAIRSVIHRQAEEGKERRALDRVVTSHYLDAFRFDATKPRTLTCRLLAVEKRSQAVLETSVVTMHFDSECRRVVDYSVARVVQRGKAAEVKQAGLLDSVFKFVSGK